MNDLYHEVLLEAAREQKNRGQLPDADYVLKAVNASCGDHVVIYLKTQAGSLEKNQSTERVTDISWEGQGCVISTAATSLLTEMIKDQQLSLSEILRLEIGDVLELLGLEQITPGRLKCLTLALQALQSGLKSAISS